MLDQRPGYGYDKEGASIYWWKCAQGSESLKAGQRGMKDNRFQA